METETIKTYLPWRLVITPGGFPQIVNSNNDEVGYVHCLEDAQQIVKAVNQYDQLRAALAAACNDISLSLRDLESMGINPRVLNETRSHLSIYLNLLSANHSETAASTPCDFDTGVSAAGQN